MHNIVQFDKAHHIPNLAWGYGRTPFFKDETYVLLAIAWGPLIQLIVVRDVGSKTGEDFYFDGYYFIAPSTVIAMDETAEVGDVWIESIKFIDESLIMAVTNTRTVRVLYTQKFLQGRYEAQTTNHNAVDDDRLISMNEEAKVDSMRKQTNEIISQQIEDLDTRAKAMPQGGLLSKDQSDVELERGNQLDQRVWPSQFGLALSQTVALFDESVLFLTEEGIMIMNHLTWTRSI